MKKRFFAIFLSALMLFTFSPVEAFAGTKAPAKPTSVTATSTTSAVTVKWKKVSGANGYVLYSYNTSSKKYSKVATTTKTTATASKLKSGTTYVYCVKAYKKSGKKTYYSSYSSKVTVSTIPSKVTGLKKTATTFTSVSVSWSKVSGASGYKLQYSTDKNFKSGVKTVSTTATSKKITSLTTNKTYYFRVYAYRTVNKKTYTSAVSSTASAKTVTTTSLSTVSESTTYQTVDGFGASAAWWAQKVGGWENAEDIIKLLYDNQEGIGLNIYRYNVGAGSSDDEELYNVGTRTEGFVTSIDDGVITYDWTNDANAQNALKIANEYSDNLRVTLFSNSPPVQMTVNGKAYGRYNDGSVNSGAYTNLDRDNYDLFAQFITEVADHFVEQGYNVTDVSPVNEPQYGWSEWKNGDGTYSAGQEGCYYSAKQLRTLYKKMATTASGKSYKISMFESGAAEGANSTFSSYLDEIMSDSTNKAYFDTVSTHSYWSNKQGKTDCASYLSSTYSNMKVACTEYCQMTNDTSTGIFDLLESLDGYDRNGLTIDFGVQLARVIYEDMTILNATEWDWWTACSNGIYTDGLIYIDDNDHSNVVTSKRLWCLGNYSKFINEGATRVKITTADSSLLASAYKNTDGTLVIVYVNQSSTDKITNVSASGYKSYSTYVTDSDKNLELNQSGNYNITNNVSIPANSVTTVVLQ